MSLYYNIPNKKTVRLHFHSKFMILTRENYPSFIMQHRMHKNPHTISLCQMCFIVDYDTLDEINKAYACRVVNYDIAEDSVCVHCNFPYVSQLYINVTNKLGCTIYTSSNQRYPHPWS